MTHGLGTRSVAVTVVDQASGGIVYATVLVTGLSTVSMTLASAPASNGMLVLVLPVINGTPSGGVAITYPNGSIAVGGTSLAPTLDVATTAVTPGSYTNASVTVNARGQVTAASSP